MLFRLLSAMTFAMHLFLVLIFVACAAKLDVPKTESIKHLKHYTGLSLPANRAYWTSAGVKVEVGDKLLIMASGTATLVPKHRAWRQMPPSKALMVKIGDSNPVMYKPKFYMTISIPGELKFIVQDPYYKDNSGSFRVDVFVIAKGREIYLSDILNDFAAQNPEDEAFKTQ